MITKRLIVNALTFARVPLVLTWAVVAIVTQLNLAKLSSLAAIVLAFVAGGAMFLAAITDLFDGKLARKWGVVSALGKMADPLMDKVFFIVTFPTLLWQALVVGGEGAMLHGVVLLLFTMLYMLRDTWVTFLRSVGSLYGADVAAMWIGKVRTALSFPAAGWIYAYLSLSPQIPLTNDAVALTVRCWFFSCLAIELFLIVLTLWTLFVYTASYAPYVKKALERK